jgi:hypothetical protein
MKKETALTLRGAGTADDTTKSRGKNSAKGRAKIGGEQLTTLAEPQMQEKAIDLQVRKRAVIRISYSHYSLALGFPVMLRLRRWSSYYPR